MEKMGSRRISWLLIVLCLLLFTVTAPVNAVPLRITESTYLPLSGSSYSVTGLVEVQNDRYVEMFMGFGVDVLMDGMAAVSPLSEIQYVSSGHFDFWSSRTDPWTDAFGRKLSMSGTAFYDAQYWSGRTDPPAYWPFASGLTYRSIDLFLDIQNPGYQPDEWDRIHIVAKAVPEPGVFLIFACGIATLAGSIWFRSLRSGRRQKT